MLKYNIELILMIQKLWLKLTAQTDQLLQKIVGTTKTMKKIVQTALALNLQNLTLNNYWLIKLCNFVLM